MRRDLTGECVKPPITAATARRRARLAKAQKGTCPQCQLPLPEDLAETEVDHIIPKARGGPNDSWNKRLVHFMCNRSKRAHLTAEAAELAAKYGVRTHQVQPKWAHATRPLTRADSEREEYLIALFKTKTADEREALLRKRMEGWAA